MAYDFTTLSPDEFEGLVADLLSREWKVRLESFKHGRDRGIDLRHTRVLNRRQQTTVVQCKRYAPHKYRELLRAIRLEKAKIAKLSPDRYVFATSVQLSPDNKAEIFAILKPWCHTTGDIFGAGDLNGLLRKFPTIEQSHFKLWIASTAVLERILHARIFNRTLATVEAAQEHLSRIIMHSGFDRALDLLHENHHVMILGNPGIGKTTLARVLLCHYLREGFEPICVSGDIEEAWDLIQSPASKDRKIVVLYDDFLGRFKFESLRFGKNEEISLLQFLEMVNRSPNLRFILTTREYILADAQRVHGAFDARADEFLRYTLRLEDYSKAHRAKMLFNHLYFSDLPDARLTRLVKSKVYREIIDHAHFNPRVVESISTYANSRAMTDDEYIRFIQHEFDNPAKLWEHPFRSDIGPLARNVLLMLWTFGGTTEIGLLRSSVERLSDVEVTSEFALAFTEALRQLDGNFISTNRFTGRDGDEGPYLIATFHNPSVEEFIDGLIDLDSKIFVSLLRGISCFRQVHRMARRMLEERNQGKFSDDAWRLIRDRASAVEAVPGGYLINYRPYGEEIRRIWDADDSDLPRDVRMRFEIEAKRSLPDPIQKQLHERVFTHDGCVSLLSGFQHDDSHAYGVQHFHEWIQKESRWPDILKAKYACAMRSAIFAVVEDEDQVWACALSSLRIFAEIVLSDGIVWSEREIEIFRLACQRVSRNIMENERTEDDIRSEASELAHIEKLIKLPLKQELDRLENRANDLAESPKDRDGDHAESHRVSAQTAEVDVDLDELFAGLLDR